MSFWGGWVFAATAMVAVAICVDEGSLTSAGMVAVADLGMIRLLTNGFGCIHHMLRHLF